MQNTPKGSRLHIALLGRRNTGKSSLINALTKQNIALVSDIPGTTTDPVYKAMEILPLGPVMFIDTAGIDDEGLLGEMRVEKTMDILKKTDVVLLIMDPMRGLGEYEEKITHLCTEKKIPLIAVFNKKDLLTPAQIMPLEEKFKKVFSLPLVWVSSINGEGVANLIQMLGKIEPNQGLPPAIVGDLLQPGDLTLLVVPIDTAAPKGRLILPQVQTLRDILDHDCLTMVCKEHGVKEALKSLNTPPALVVTDSQAFKKVAADLPPNLPLTSFSILMARYKGDLPTLAQGAKAVENLQPGDKILIAEACTHHQQPDDIGKIKIPRWLKEKIGGELVIDFANGTAFPAGLEEYKLVVHCGSCMLNRREMLYRIEQVRGKGIPIVNYGILIAYLHGILPRALAPFGIDFGK